MSLYVGCPIWSFKGWVGNFYPGGTKPADYLREYARRVTTIEGNTTFYAVPAKKILEGWVADTPEAFRFCPKVPKAISHAGRLADNTGKAKAFGDVMRQLGARLGPMFMQLPPSYSPRLWEDLKSFLEAWPRDLRLGVEVRHLDWFDSPRREDLNQLLADHHMARVVIDTRPIRSLDGDKSLEGSVYQTLLEARQRKPNVPVFEEKTTDFTFLRFIGHPKMEQNLALVEEWVNHLSSQLSAGGEAFVFCHSPDNMIAPHLCREFHRRVADHINLPPLPWDEIDSSTLQQGQLF